MYNCTYTYIPNDDTEDKTIAEEGDGDNGAVDGHDKVICQAELILR